jgi:hypothetical protein
MKNKTFLILGMIAAQSAVSAYANYTADYASDAGQSGFYGNTNSISGTVNTPTIGSASGAAIEAANNQLIVAKAAYVNAANEVATRAAAIKAAQAAYAALSNTSAPTDFVNANSALSTANSAYNTAVTAAQTAQGKLVQVQNQVNAIIKANSVATAAANAQRAAGARMQQGRWGQQQGRWGKQGRWNQQRGYDQQDRYSYSRG